MKRDEIICGILKNESDDSFLKWAEACRKYNLKYDIIDIFSFNWLNAVLLKNYNFYLACPPGLTLAFKQAYDEKINIIVNQLKKIVFPSYTEILLHENKKFLSYWLEANGIPHPATHVFFKENEALEFAKEALLPIVVKSNIGASGSGVKIIRDQSALNYYILKAFKKGIKRSTGPNLRMGNVKNRLLYSIKNPAHVKERVQVYKKVFKDIQKAYVILQEYIPHDFEWRIVRIGDSYFGHKKIKKGDKASGTKGIQYDLPSGKLLGFIKETCDKYHFDNVAIDLFEHPEKGFLINEIQTIFGHVQDYICAKDGKPGKLSFIDNNWRFEEGRFNDNLSYNLRLESLLKRLDIKLD